jgi:hypothetical protein
MEAVRGRDVQVAKVFQARCHREDCAWPGGPLRGTFADAATDREEHLAAHRTSASRLLRAALSEIRESGG